MKDGHGSCEITALVTLTVVTTIPGPPTSWFGGGKSGNKSKEFSRQNHRGTLGLICPFTWTGPSLCAVIIGLSGRNAVPITLKPGAMRGLTASCVCVCGEIVTD